MSVYDSTALYKTLVELSVIDKKALDAALVEAKANKIPLDELLVDQELISAKDIGQVVADVLGAPFVALKEQHIDDAILSIIPELVATKQQMIAFKKDKRGLHVACTDPSNLGEKEFLKKKTGLPVIFYYAPPRDVAQAMTLYGKNVTQVFDQIIQTNIKAAKDAKGDADPPIIKIVDTMLSYGYQNNASDIHIEPTDAESLVRFRIDGILHDVVKLPRELHDAIVTRVKVMSKLRTDEHASSQDGKLQAVISDETLDVRVSIVPITNGEKIVLRLLSEKSRGFGLTDLGFGMTDLKKVEEAFKKPYGMLLSTGPTGCGKTTTLYAVLKLLNKRDVNIMTIEDPVEYEIEGVNQIQVNVKTNLTFAKGLRSIVRQDPNIILVGEIRDAETAGIAVNSAMTGHLVLSTLHTNDAATAIPRLFDMEVEPFLVASSVNVIIAQRLVRTICIKCRVSEEVTKKTMATLLQVSEAFVSSIYKEEACRTYKGKGCPVCHDTGYVGRIGLFEVMEITDAVRDAITSKKDANTIKSIAVSEGMTTMMMEGIKKVKAGVTTLEEVMRVARE